MLPINHPIWVQIVTGKKPIRGDNLAINMLAQKNKLSYEKDPSPANVKQLVENTHLFFIKYEAAFAADFAKILH